MQVLILMIQFPILLIITLTLLIITYNAFLKRWLTKSIRFIILFIIIIKINNAKTFNL